MRALVLALGLLLTATPVVAGTVDLTVRFDGIEARGGSLRVGLFDSAQGFAQREDGVVATQAVSADGETVVVHFDGLAPGHYAITAFHDADDDGSLDKALGVLPREGVALSNDPALVPPPAFDAMAVDVTMDAEVTVRFRYLGG
ncbi:MAG: DUF2141 domain-containing protein [Pseudomonadota bacterium]